MEDSRRIIELLLALALVGILSLISIMVIQNNEDNSQDVSQQYITNNYYNYNQYSVQDTPPSQKIISEIYYKKNIDGKRFYYLLDEEESNEVYYDYDKYASQKTRKDFLGTYVKEYYVYILNKEDRGRYFTVVFKFEDQRGYEYSESITEYIKAGEKKKFNYRDIQFEKGEIVDWSYKIVPERA